MDVGTRPEDRCPPVGHVGEESVGKRFDEFSADVDGSIVLVHLTRLIVHSVLQRRFPEVGREIRRAEPIQVRLGAVRVVEYECSCPVRLAERRREDRAGEGEILLSVVLELGDEFMDDIRLFTGHDAVIGDKVQ